jgi:hypothetical protein
MLYPDKTPARRGKLTAPKFQAHNDPKRGPEGRSKKKPKLSQREGGYRVIRPLPIVRFQVSLFQVPNSEQT